MKLRTVVNQQSSTRQTVKTSITLEPELYRQAKLVADVSGYRFSFSGFVADLLREKLKCQNQRLNPNQARG